jgi:hypothetical protein
LPGGKFEKVVPIENEFDLICHIQFEAEGRKFGAYLLSWAETKYRAVFGFDCDGIHPNLPDAQLDSTFYGTSNGFKDLPEGELLTFHAKSFVEDSERRNYLIKLINNTTNPILKYHALSLLINSEESLPTADYRWVRVKKRFTAVMAMLDRPDGWEDERDCLNYFWSKLSQDLVNDVEIITQLSKVDQTLVRAQLKDLTKEQIFRAVKAAEDGDVGVAATIDLQEAIDARATLHRGDVALSCSTVFLVHRDSLDKLDRACNYLESLFLYPANLNRETTYTWKTWAQTFPVTWTPLLKFPYNRLGRIFSEYVLGTIPLSQVSTVDKSGFEFISHDGGVPIALDMINSQHHMMLLATQRVGKSVVITSMVNDFLLNNVPVSIIDYPPTDDASTFKDYTILLGYAYLYCLQN